MRKIVCFVCKHWYYYITNQIKKKKKTFQICASFLINYPFIELNTESSKCIRIRFIIYSHRVPTYIKKPFYQPYCITVIRLFGLMNDLLDIISANTAKSRKYQFMTIPINFFTILP